MESDFLPVASQCAAWSHNNGGRYAFKPPAVYDFDSDDEDSAYVEEAFEAVLPECAQFENLSREQAVGLLKTKNCDGMYLTRASINVESGRVLSVWYKGKCRHYRFYYDQAAQLYSLDVSEVSFSNISTVVAYYMLNDLPKSECTLTVPYGQSARPIRIRRLPFEIKFTANRKKFRITQQLHVP